MLGLGALALPSVFARLGWLPASVLLAACALGALYSGRLFTAMAQQVWCFYQSCMPCVLVNTPAGSVQHESVRPALLRQKLPAHCSSAGAAMYNTARQ